MIPDEAFLRAIRKAPEDDAPRLIYADWLEEQEQTERADFIRIQCRYARMPETELERSVLMTRADLLLRRNWQAWVGPLREIVGPWRDRYGESWLRDEYHADGLLKFQRGFVDTLSLNAESYLRYARRLQALAPIRVLHLWGAGRCAATLAQESTLSGLLVLGFTDYYDSPLMAGDMGVLAASPYLEGLRGLLLGRNSLGDEGVEALAQAPWLVSVVILDLTDNGLSDRGARALADSPYLVNLVALHLRRNFFSRAGIAALRDSPNLRQTVQFEYDPPPGNVLL
jgi:uncharacterized protein (TIGR02996 family)